MTGPNGNGRGAQPAYRIGAAARLIGLSTHTLRKWEDRYGVVSPGRSPGGERLYSALDVRRLTRVRELSQAGHALAQLATLDEDQLERLCGELRQRSPATAGAPRRLDVVVVGPALTSTLRQERAAVRQLSIVSCGEDTEQAAHALGDANADVLVLECPAVGAGTAAEVRAAMGRLGAGAAVVVYGFGARADLDALRGPNVAPLRAPADAIEIERACIAMVAPPYTGPGAPTPQARPRRPRLTSDSLARVAATSGSIACECPRHLVDLIRSLSAFEEYSAACENRDDADAALHRYLYVTTAAARSMFEDALVRLAAHEGLDL